MTTICTVLKRFPYSADGLKTEILDVGATPPIRDELVAGLVAEGYVAKGGTPAIGGSKGAGGGTTPAGGAGGTTSLEERGKIEIPAEWTNMAWPALRSLASKLADDGVPDKDAAIAAIEAELKRRAG